MIKNDDCESKYAAENVDDYEATNEGIISNLPKISIPIGEGNEGDVARRENNYSDNKSDSGTPKKSEGNS